MLIDSVKRLDVNGTIKLYNIDKHVRPALIKSVPALTILPSKDILYGKQVFDHLLLPSRGILVTGGAKPTAPIGPTVQTPQGPSEPMGFASSKSSMSSNFASFTDDRNDPLGSQSDSWAWMGDIIENKEVSNATPSQNNNGSGSGNTNSPFGIETRDLSSKALPDMESILQRREQDLRAS